MSSYQRGPRPNNPNNNRGPYLNQPQLPSSSYHPSSSDVALNSTWTPPNNDDEFSPLRPTFNSNQSSQQPPYPIQRQPSNGNSSINSTYPPAPQYMPPSPRSYASPGYSNSPYPSSGNSNKLRFAPPPRGDSYDADWGRRAQPVKRGMTRKVKLHMGNFSNEYRVPQVVQNSVEKKWREGSERLGEKEGSEGREFRHMR
jgi:hypothetical protein